jgi:hypothetical protein
VPRGSPQDEHASLIEATIDRLYSLGPGEFVTERNEAAKRLRAKGDRAGSDLIHSLRRPTVAAWAVNQLSRRRPDLVGDLLEAGTALRSAQRAALAGSRKGDLRGLAHRRRVAVAALADEADLVLRETGRDPDAHADAIRSTLEAASADEATGNLVRWGRLTRDVEPPSGLGDTSSFEVLQGGRATSAETARDESPAARRIRERTEQRVAKARDALAVAREAARSARREAEVAAKEVARLKRELRTAQYRAERASKAATVASDRVKSAKHALTQAQPNADL